MKQICPQKNMVLFTSDAQEKEKDNRNHIQIRLYYEPKRGKILNQVFPAPESTFKQKVKK